MGYPLEKITKFTSNGPRPSSALQQVLSFIHTKGGRWGSRGGPSTLVGPNREPIEASAELLGGSLSEADVAAHGPKYCGRTTTQPAPRRIIAHRCRSRIGRSRGIRAATERLQLTIAIERGSTQHRRLARIAWRKLHIAKSVKSFLELDVRRCEALLASNQSQWTSLETSPTRRKTEMQFVCPKFELSVASTRT